MAAAGLAWMALAKPSDLWTPTQAAELKAAGSALHAARRSEPEASQGTIDASLAAAQTRFDRINAELEEARTGRQRTGSWLVRLGLAAMVLFGVGYFSSRSE